MCLSRHSMCVVFTILGAPATKIHSFFLELLRHKLAKKVQLCSLVRAFVPFIASQFLHCMMAKESPVHHASLASSVLCRHRRIRLYISAAVRPIGLRSVLISRIHSGLLSLPSGNFPITSGTILADQFDRLFGTHAIASSVSLFRPSQRRPAEESKSVHCTL
jgi:hypothetical protein